MTNLAGAQQPISKGSPHMGRICYCSFLSKDSLCECQFPKKVCQYDEEYLSETENYSGPS